jgi:hypothetical protein
MGKSEGAVIGGGAGGGSDVDTVNTAGGSVATTGQNIKEDKDTDEVVGKAADGTASTGAVGSCTDCDAGGGHAGGGNETEEEEEEVRLEGTAGMCMICQDDYADGYGTREREIERD